MNYIKSNNEEEVKSIMDKYYDSLGIENVLSSRNRKHLVPRVAFVNGISDYFTLKALGDAMGKHHATILHYLKLDETYSMHYKSYGYFKRGARSIYDLSFGDSQVVKRMLSKIEEYKQELEENEALES